MPNCRPNNSMLGCSLQMPNLQMPQPQGPATLHFKDSVPITMRAQTTQRIPLMALFWSLWIVLEGPFQGSWLVFVQGIGFWSQNTWMEGMWICWVTHSSRRLQPAGNAMTQLRNSMPLLGFWIRKTVPALGPQLILFLKYIQYNHKEPIKIICLLEVSGDCSKGPRWAYKVWLIWSANGQGAI